MKVFIKYILSGFLMLGAKLALTYFFTDILGIYYYYSYIITLGIIIISSFLLNIYFIFGSSGKMASKFVKYAIALVTFYFLDALLFRFLTEFIKLYYLYSIVFDTLFIAVLKFFVYKFLIFKTEDKKDEENSTLESSGG